MSIKENIDLSGYLKNTVLGAFFDPENEKVPGKFSDEKPIEIIKEVIALKPKMYSIKTQRLLCEIVSKREEHTKRGKASQKYAGHVCESSCFVGGSTTAKGINKQAQKHITHEEYGRILNERTTNMITNIGFEMKEHQIFTVLKRKQGLSAYDDKKHILEDGVNTLSYGHYLLK